MQEKRTNQIGPFFNFINSNTLFQSLTIKYIIDELNAYSTNDENSNDENNEDEYAEEDINEKDDLDMVPLNQRVYKKYDIRNGFN